MLIGLMLQKCRTKWQDMLRIRKVLLNITKEIKLGLILHSLKKKKKKESVQRKIIRYHIFKEFPPSNPKLYHV